MKTLRAMAIACVAIALCSCSTLSSLTSTGPTEQNAVAAAETSYTAITNLADTAVKTGKLSLPQLQTLKGIEAQAYHEVVVARTAVANGDSAAVRLALDALTQLQTQMVTAASAAAH